MTAWRLSHDEMLSSGLHESLRLDTDPRDSHSSATNRPDAWRKWVPFAGRTRCRWLRGKRSSARVAGYDESDGASAAHASSTSLSGACTEDSTCDRSHGSDTERLLAGGLCRGAAPFGRHENTIRTGRAL